MTLKENDTGRQRTTELNNAVDRQQAAVKKERPAKMTFVRAMRQNQLRHQVSQIAPARNLSRPSIQRTVGLLINIVMRLTLPKFHLVTYVFILYFHFFSTIV